MARLRDVPGDTRPLIAFCGDSNVYGLYLDRPEDTISKQVETLIRDRSPGDAFRTLNLALPASASWTVLEQVKRALELRPRALVVRTGVNNLWQLPPDQGLGLFEQLKLVRIWRLWTANRRAPQTAAPTLGPGGEALQGAAVTTGHNRSELRLKTREGTEMPFEIVSAGGSVSFARAAGRLRQDYEEMAQRASDASVPIVFATYLENAAADYDAIRKLMLSLEGRPGVQVADCAPVGAKAIAGDSAMPPPRTVAIARRSLILTRDCHPTALGYALEARVVAEALSRAGVLEHYQSPPALEPMGRAEIDIPKIRHKKDARGTVEVFSKPGDRVYLLAGIPGESYYRETSIPIDYKTLTKDAYRIQPPVAPVTELREAGRADLRIDEDKFRRLPGNALLMAMIERGGQYGAARILISNTIGVPR